MTFLEWPGTFRENHLE